MHKLLIFCLGAVLCLPLATPVSAQVCGDVTNDTKVNLSDLSTLIAYLSNYSAPTLPNPSLGDVDGRTGITWSDVVTMWRYLAGGSGTLNCSPTLSYEFAASPADTVFLPRMLAVPDGIQQVALPVITSFRDSCQGAYFPLMATATPHFGLGTIDEIANHPYVMHTILSDTLLLGLVDNNQGERGLFGTHTYWTLHYTRTSPGIDNIEMLAVDRSTMWRFAIERNGNLFIPTIVYYDVTPPTDTLLATPAALTFSTRQGKPATDTFTVSFSATTLPAAFTLAASEPWITLVDYPPAGLTTPASVKVAISAEAPNAGSYTGAITITPTDPAVTANPTAVSVALTILPPMYFPNGDLNCDGRRNLVDLSYMIAFMVGNVPPPQDCK